MVEVLREALLGVPLVVDLQVVVLRVALQVDRALVLQASVSDRKVDYLKEHMGIQMH